MGVIGRGPALWENWRDIWFGDFVRITHDYAFYTDSFVQGLALTGERPYELYASETPRQRVRRARVGVILHAERSQSRRMRGRGEDQETLFAIETGAAGEDGQMAALISLALGVRMRSGGMIGRAGRLVMHHQEPYLFPTPDQPLAPSFIRDGAVPADLKEADPFLQRYVRLNGADALTLTRACRSYQQATWVAEGDPAQSWLHLVSAAETCASALREKVESDSLFKEYEPELAERAWKDWPRNLYRRLSSTFGQTHRSTRLFVRFLMNHGSAESKLTPELLGGHLKQVYAARSAELHKGVHMPYAMLRRSDNEEGTVLKGDTPVSVEITPEVSYLSLNAFAKIVRFAILKWSAELPLDAATTNGPRYASQPPA